MSESTNTAALVAELRQGARDWDIAVAHEIDTYGAGTEDAIGMADRAAMYRRAAEVLSALAKELEEARERAEQAEGAFAEGAYDDACERDVGVYQHALAFAVEKFRVSERQRDEALAALKASEAREGEMREALRPFADFCEQAEHFVAARAADGRTSIFPTKHFRLEHFRRARAVLSTKEMGS